VRPTHLFASIPVADLERAAAWYARLLDRPPDLVPNATERAWQISAAGWIYLIVDPPRAGATVHTILVEDLDEELARAAAQGIGHAAPVQIGPGVRKATITDPDANRLEFGEVAGEQPAA
jgi:predicted enzyme related to lactoylglutathione lyase